MDKEAKINTFYAIAVVIIFLGIFFVLNDFTNKSIKHCTDNGGNWTVVDQKECFRTTPYVFGTCYHCDLYPTK